MTVEFVVIGVSYLSYFAGYWWGADARIYHRALLLWLSGANPYDASWNGIGFAAPPITLVPLAPFAVVSEDTFVLISAGASVCAALWVVRRLRLPPYWLIFPPIVEGVIVGNPNGVVVALLLSSAAPIGVLLKAYAIVPIAGLAKYRMLAASIAIILITFPFLPWGEFLKPEIFHRLSEQANAERSAFGHPIEFIAVICSLLILGRVRASWLIVPGIWPATQFHYSILALPAIDRFMGAIMAIPLPGAAPAGIIGSAAIHLLRDRLKVIRAKRARRTGD